MGYFNEMLDLEKKKEGFKKEECSGVDKLLPPILQTLHLAL